MQSRNATPAPPTVGFLRRLNRGLFLRDWQQLRTCGNLYLMKLSYFSLILVPFFTRHEALTQRLGIQIWFMAVIFYASVLLAMANLIYDLCCPRVVRVHGDPEDYYHEMLRIKDLSARNYPEDRFDASLERCGAFYEKACRTKPILRFLCTMLFNVSALLFLGVIGYRFVTVTQSLIVSWTDPLDLQPVLDPNPW